MISRGAIATAAVAVALSAWPLRLAALDAGPPPELAAAEQRYRETGPQEALPALEELLVAYRKEANGPAIAMTETLIGDCHWRLGQTDEARRFLDAALEHSRELGFRRQEGKALNLQGLLAWDLGDYPAAETHFQKASAIAREVGDRRLEGSALNNLSLVYDELGEYSTSLAQYERVLAIYASVDFARGEGDTLGNIGGVHLLLGHFSEAVDYYRRALNISEELGAVPAQSQDHGNLGYAYTGLGAFDEAISHFRTALELAERSGMVLEQGYWLRGLANVQVRSGRPDLGLVNHRAALEIYRAAAANGLLLEGLHDLGRLMLELGDPVSAEQYFQQAMELAQSIDHARGITQNLVALGDLQFRHGRPDEAEALYLQSLQRAEASGEQSLQVVGLLRLAALALEQGQNDAARSAAQQANEIAQAIGSLPGQAEARLALAGERLARDEFADALATYTELDPTLATLGDPDLAWQADYGRGLALIGLGRKADAVTALQAAVERIENVRSRLQEKRFRTGYLQNKHQVYIELVRLQLDLGLNDAALTTAERLRMLSFNEQRDGVTGPVDAGGEAAAFELRERIRQLQQALGIERAQPGSVQRQAAIEHFSRELLLAEQHYQAWLDDATVSSRAPSPPPVSERVARAHKSLAADEAMIEYVVAEETVMIFVLRPAGLNVATVPATRDNLRSRIRLLRDLIAQRDETRWTKPAARLAADLLEPVAEAGWLKGVRRLYLVPHGVLNYLPFAVLPADGDGDAAATALIDRYTLAYLPTALALPHAGGAAAADWSLLGVAPASSRLRHAPIEASTIARLFEPYSRVLDGTAATETLFRRIAPNYQVLHLATHGYFNKFNPLLSGLEMEADEASDGRLEVHEILRLRLRSDLVTLSACETGLGSGFFTEIPAGDDFVGMTRAFLQAGSAAVLASLWEVDDRSTVDLMTSFYGELKQPPAQGDKAWALAAAQRSIKAKPNFRHPYFWAPFILVGAAGPTGAPRG